MVFLTERINFRQEKHSGLSKNKRGVSRPGVGHFPLSPTGYFLSLAKEGHSAPRHGELSFVSDGLFSFSSERKEEKKRRQKLRFWISLRGFTWFLSCQNKPRKRCAAEISPKCCTVSASLFAAAFALKCRAVWFFVSWQDRLSNGGPWPPPTFAALRQRRDLIIACPGGDFQRGGAVAPPHLVVSRGKDF